MMTFLLFGRWDDLEEISNPNRLLDKLHEIAGGCYMVHDLNKGADVVGNLKDDQGNPFEDFGVLQRSLYSPPNIPVGTYTVCGIDTAANSYPAPTEISLDKQGNPITIEVTSEMTVFDICTAVVALTETLFDGFPHHCYFEELIVDPATMQLRFSMGS